MALEKLGVEAVIKGLSSFMTGMNKMDKSIEDVGKSSEKTGKISDKLAQNWAGLATAAASLGAAVFAAKKYFDFAEEGAQLLRLEQAGESLAKSFGTSMDVIVDAVDEASRGTVSRADIIQAANRAMLLGVASSAEEMAQLMEVASVRGKAMGLSMTQAFNDIVTGIGRASPMILDNLGIVTGGEQVYVDFAESIGKTKDQLTDAEKKTALFNAVLESTVPLLEEAAKGGEDIASEFERAHAQIKNLTDELKKFAAIGVGRAITAGETLVTMDEKIAEALENTYEELIKTTDSYEDYWKAIVGIADGTNRMIITQSEYNERIEKGGISARIAEKSVVMLTEAEYERQKQLERNRETMGLERDLHVEVHEAMAESRRKIEDLVGVQETQEEITKRVNEQYGKLKDLMKVDLTESFVEFQGKVQDLTGEISNLEGMDYLTDEQKTQLEESREELDKTIKKWREYTAQVIFNIAAQALEREGLTEEEAIALAKTAEGLGLVDEGYAALTESVYESANSLNYMGDQSDEFAGAMERLVEQLSDATIEADNLDEAIRKIPTSKEISIITTYGRRALARQYGGDVERGLPYLVGEKGPELFIPDISGNILSNMMTKAMGQVSSSVTNTNTSYGDNLNLHIHTSAPTENVVADFRMLKAMGSRT